MSWLDLTIAEMHQALVAKKVTPLELTEEAIERLKVNQDNVLEADTFERAIDFAATLKEPEIDNPFWGIPVLIKDNISTRGVETTASSDILNGYVPVYDATVVKILKDAKAVIIAKTTLDELAMGGTGTSGHKGITYNPWDPEHKRITGGSSAGSASAVSAGIVPFALGSDTGDSVRKPASFNGLVGFKPTWGRISRYGLFSFTPSLDHIGYFARSVEDAALALSLLAGPDEKDMTSSQREVENYEADLKTGVKGLKIAVINNLLELVDPVLIKLIKQNLIELEKAGAIISYLEADMSILKAIFPTYYIISCAEATSNNANLDGLKFGYQPDGKSYQEIMKKARTAGFSPTIKRRFVVGSYVLRKANRAEFYEPAQKARRIIVDAANKVLAEHDAIYLPAAPSIAPKIADLNNAMSEEEYVADNHMIVANLGGFPSLTLPIGFKEGMPLGINITGQPFSETKLLQIGSSIEKITGLRNISARKGIE